MSDHDYTQTVSMRLSKAQLELLKHCATEHRVSVSDLRSRWILDLDVLPMIPAELKSIIRQKTDAATRGKDLEERAWVAC